MRPINSLRVILMVRRRSEEAAERALAGTAREILQWRIHAEKLKLGLVEITASRMRQIHCVATADHYQSSEARHRALLQQCAEADKNVERLEALRAQQMAAYMEARRAREMAETLEEESRRARQAEIALREQKWNEDLFLARRVANSNKTMSSEDSFGSKESA